MKRKIVLFAVMVVALVFVAACSRDEETPTTGNQGGGAAPAAEDGRMFAETFQIRWLEEGRPHLYGDNNMVEQMINEMLNVEI
ncbi:MAG: hypothetical protein FWC89_14535, partial [Defluviitaleaceae bacterium]|nr:hypothetical protein [Defluviitaleaceae bacterium]